MKTLFKTGLIIFLLSLFLPLPKLAADAGLPLPDVEPEISMDFQDANLKDVLKIFSIQSGMNFLASEGVQDRKLTLYMDKVPLSQAMKKLFKANNLSYDLDKEAKIFIVKDWGKPTTETVTKVFYLKNATISASSLKEEMKNNLSGTSASFTPGESDSGSTTSSSDSGGTDSGKWKVEDEAGITYAVKKLLSENGSVIEDYRTNSLVVTDTPGRMEVISQVIAALDVPVPQVLLEVEMLDVSKDMVDEIGVNWPTTLASLDFYGTKRITNLFGSKGPNPKSWTLEVDDTPTGFSFGPWGADHFGPTVFSVINANLTFDFLSTQTDTKILARPRVMTLNNETAEIRIATDEAIGLTQSTTSTGGTGTTTSEAERFETGVILRVTPQINVDTGEVTLFVYPRVANANLGQTFTVADLPYQFRDPEERSTKQVLRIKDGETVVIGGLIRNDSQQVINKLPVLGDLPLVGGLFRHTSRTPNEERELLVFITPHILKDNNKSNIELAKGPKRQAPLPLAQQREQSPAATINRQASINNYISNYEK
jgi:type II secretory pathway component GspD/PulD (secretin)